jgi:hypothetical protein
VNTPRNIENTSDNKYRKIRKIISSKAFSIKLLSAVGSERFISVPFITR